MSERIACSSVISRVTVYARSAVVTRKIDLPASLPTGSCTLLIGGVTPMAEPASLRTQADGERAITGLNSRIVQMAQPATPSHSDAAHKLQLEAQRLEAAMERSTVRRDHLAELTLQTAILSKKSDTNASGRMHDALQISALVNELTVKLDAELSALQLKRQEIERLLEESGLGGQQSANPQTGPSREIEIRLAAGPAHLRSLEVSYSVAAARWWPAYAARITDQGKRAEFALEAFVVQQSLEDWRGVTVSLCTADMVQDIRLPELPSLRLGRAQSPRRKGYRLAPEGLDALFAGFDSVMSGVNYAEPQPSEPPRPKSAPAKSAGKRRDKMRESVAAADDGAVGAVEYQRDECVEESASYASMKSAEPEYAPAPPIQAQATNAPLGAMMPASPARGAPMNAMKDQFGAGGGLMPPADTPTAPDVAEDWLDFDSLMLHDVSQRGRRGRLTRAGQAGFDASPYVNAVEHASVPATVTDPRQARGLFDHQFEATGKVEIPANGRAHRIHLMAREAACAMRFVCVACEDDRVFREAEIQNPLEAPLLPGPVDVFVEGLLLTTSPLSAVDRGGRIRIGLGVEERLRVTRNVRANEETRGMLGGSTAVNHSISVEVASSLAADASVEIIERLPVTTDKEIQVSLTKAEPRPEDYDQKQRGQPVRGGKRFLIAVKAGAKAALSMDYSIVLPAGSEIVGGNRRE